MTDTCSLHAIVVFSAHVLGIYRLEVLHTRHKYRLETKPEVLALIVTEGVVIITEAEPS